MLSWRAFVGALAVFLAAGCAHAVQFQRPEVIRFGASQEEIDVALTGQCESKRAFRVSEREAQIDCNGYAFRGQGRHVEFVFRNDRLEVVWLMMTPAEAEATIATMTLAYGAPTTRDAAYVIFAQERAAWRFQPAEILFYAPEIDDNVAFELTH